MDDDIIGGANVVGTIAVEDAGLVVFGGSDAFLT